MFTVLLLEQFLGPQMYMNSVFLIFLLLVSLVFNNIIFSGRTMMSDDATSIELYSKNSIYTERNTVLSIPKVKSDFQD